MTFEQFLDEFDQAEKIILLIGKREVSDLDSQSIIAMGKRLANESKNMRFRSGNAPGADTLFCQGVSMVDGKQIEVITPYKDHRAKHAENYTKRSLDDINLVQETRLLYETKKNKKHAKQVDRYAEGKRDVNAIKASYIIRDTLLVIGGNNIPPTDAVLYYDNLLKPLEGGTGHTIKMCMAHNIPVFNQRIWKNWVDTEN